VQEGKNHRSTKGDSNHARPNAMHPVLPELMFNRYWFVSPLAQ